MRCNGEEKEEETNGRFVLEEKKQRNSLADTNSPIVAQTLHLKRFSSTVSSIMDLNDLSGENDQPFSTLQRSSGPNLALLSELALVSSHSHLLKQMNKTSVFAIECSHIVVAVR